MDGGFRTTRRLVAGMVAIAAVWGAGPAPVRGQGETAPARSVVVKTIEEHVLSGELTSFSLQDGAIVVVNGVAREIPGPDLVRISTPQTVWARGPRDATLTLTDGSMISGLIVDGEEESVALETRDFGKINLPLESVSAILTPNAYQEQYRETSAWLEQARLEGKDQDQVLLTNGDVLSGFVSAVTSEGIQFEGTLGKTVLSHRVVVGVRLANSVPEVEHRPRVVVTLRSSGRFSATACRLNDGTLEARMAQGPSVQIEAERLVSLDFFGGRWEWLSDHHPISVEHTPMLALDWEMEIDRNVLGSPIRVAGERFRHGIGVHGRTRIAYDLKGAYSELVTQFGIDDHSGPLADVDVAILVDGQRRFAKTGVRRGRLHGPVRVDVTRANRVELITDYGKNGDLQDRFDWVEPALVR